MSIYATMLDGRQWSTSSFADHNHTKVISGISTTALLPSKAAEDLANQLLG
jgi:hypothetical protein